MPSLIDSSHDCKYIFFSFIQILSSDCVHWSFSATRARSFSRAYVFWRSRPKLSITLHISGMCHFCAWIFWGNHFQLPLHYYVIMHTRPWKLLTIVPVMSWQPKIWANLPDILPVLSWQDDHFPTMMPNLSEGTFIFIFFYFCKHIALHLKINLLHDASTY